MSEINKDKLKKVLSNIEEPKLEVKLISTNLIRNIEISDKKVTCDLILIAPDHPDKDSMIAEIEEALKSLPEVEQVEVSTKIEVPLDSKLTNESGNVIRNVIAVASGKGGVGKSTVSVNIAIALAQSGMRVGLMDADIYGPNIPMMMGVDKLPASQSAEKITAAENYGVKIISIGFMVKPEQALIWRGPMLHSAIKQFVTDVDWGELDYLVVDLPPGTGDVQLSLTQTLELQGGVIVTLPQQVSLDDALRGINMFQELKVPIFGVIENRGYLETPEGERMDIFGSGGGEKLAKMTGVSYLGSIPIDPQVRIGGDQGMPVALSHPDSPVSQSLYDLAEKIAAQVSIQAIKGK